MPSSPYLCATGQFTARQVAMAESRRSQRWPPPPVRQTNSHRIPLVDEIFEHNSKALPLPSLPTLTSRSTVAPVQRATDDRARRCRTGTLNPLAHRTLTLTRTRCQEWHADGEHLFPQSGVPPSPTPTLVIICCHRPSHAPHKSGPSPPRLGVQPSALPQRARAARGGIRPRPSHP
jgi:hypothetical protein